MKNYKIAVAGTGYVGLSIATLLSQHHHNGVSLRNLVNLIYSRGELISKATDGIFLADKGLVDALKDDSCTYAVANFIHAVKEYEEQHGASLEGLTITDEKVTFTGFPTAPDYDHLTAFGHLAILMNQQAISQKRIQAKEVNDSNEKYALRTWLLRLGMNGPDFKQTRKILIIEPKKVHYRADEIAFRVLLCVNGCGTISYEGGTIPFYKGDCIFVPADSETLTIHGQAQFLDVRG